MLEAARIQKAFLLVAIIAFFFMPCVQLAGFGASCFDATKLGGSSNLLWIVPGLAAAALFILVAHDYPLPSFVAGVSPIVTFFVAKDVLGPDQFGVLGIGAYGAIFSGGLLALLSILHTPWPSIVAWPFALVTAGYVVLAHHRVSEDISQQLGVQVRVGQLVVASAVFFLSYVVLRLAIGGFRLLSTKQT